MEGRVAGRQSCSVYLSALLFLTLILKLRAFIMRPSAYSHILSAVIALASSLLLAACSFVHEDLPPCEHRLHFVYDYNMKFADAWPHEADQVSLFIFDEEGNYLKEMNISADEARANNILLDLQPGTYRMLAWTGLTCNDYLCLATSADRTTSHIEDYSVRLTAEAQRVDRDLVPLFYGMHTVTIPDAATSDIRFPLMKDTNTFRLIVQADAGNKSGSIPSDEFEFSITDDNAWLTYSNQVVAKGHPLTYAPYYLGDGDIHDPEGNVVLTTTCAELNTNRLTYGTHPRLTIRHKPTNKVWLNVDLIEYLMLMPTEGSLDKMLDREHPQQEYLDREDEYVIVFFFTEGAGGNMINVRITINGWTVRLNNVEM